MLERETREYKGMWLTGAQAQAETATGTSAKPAL